MIKLMPFFSILALFVFGGLSIKAQAPEAMILPDLIKPTPEVSNLIKAENLSVNYSTGSPNMSVPIGTLSVSGINLPINVSYNSTGIKVDEYASNVGTGWTCSYGGVISRTVLGKADESRASGQPNNLRNVNFNSLDGALIDFLKNNTDAESDIFNFSFLNYSGKFILDSTLQTVIPLSNYNLIIKPNTTSLTGGFIIITEDGTTYTFEDAETSKSRNPLGTSCPKNLNSTYYKTSWYLTKITAPNKRSNISFTYTSSDIYFEQSITQYISRVISSEQYPGGSCQGGNACSVGAEIYYTCVPRQLVTSKFISKIVSSAGDSVLFTYDASAREDIDGGKRLSQVKIKNRNGVILKQVSFYGSYPSGIGSSGYGYSSKRLFLDSLKMDDYSISANTLTYKFDYYLKDSVAARLTVMQDLYGYNNGKSGNASLIPKLPSTDMNYTHFNVGGNGNGGTSVSFGDRSIDTTYAIRGLLKKITYPTGGFDTLIYQPNKVYRSGTTTLAGGFSISAIQSWSFGQIAAQRLFNYIDSNDHSSTFLLTDQMVYSDQIAVKKDGFWCGTTPYCEGPSCTFASVSSNQSNPITSLEGQHAYHRYVTERYLGTINNGYTLHHYTYFGGGNIYPADKMGNKIMSAPFQVVNDFLIGEDTTKIYRYDTATSSYKLQKQTINYYRFGNFVTYNNYVIKNNFLPLTTSNPPVQCDFGPFDVAQYGVNRFNVFTDSTYEAVYDKNSQVYTTKTYFEYEDALQTYPTKMITYGSDGIKQEVRKKYPLDFSGGIYDKMIVRNIVVPSIEEKFYRNDTLITTTTKTYADWFSDTTVIAIQQTEYKELTNAIPAHINYINYDTLANVLELAKDSGAHMTYIWDYGKQLPVAKISNAAANEVYYNSFEESGGTTDNNAKTGSKSYSGNYAVSFSIPNSKSYTITYWAWNGSAWIYHEASYTGSTTLTGTKIDEVRIFPSDAKMITFTFEPLLGMTSQCDVRNQVTYYEYDTMGRLKMIRDADRKILKLFDYKYQQ